MKNLLILFALLLGFTSCSRNKNEQSELKHIVLFDFVEGITPDQVDLVVDAFKALPSKIEVIQNFECGSDVSPEGLQKGYDYAFVLTFKNEADRDVYLPHPDHKALGGIISPYIQNVLVVDFLTK